MVQSYQEFWHNILNFSGTARRRQYWWPIIINYLLGAFIIALIEHSAGHPITDIYNWTDWSVNFGSQVVTFIVWLGTLSLKFRRLHDSDHSGGWVLMELIPIIGTIWFFILMILPSRANRWD
ncbi:DUF805 domain-containing protein [Lactobacillus sp. DCY120]|uniref:DUF805 domain-containing protein n=1 Tax=Bombilactobacillus apium TaxID=2675299 RepID=A0A850QYM4_9LACO|nr:DUF805 domain-containing protein [Bombilactobacillus apium]NVY96944.1 DUF805 domain-containing protein [Bombilactobacillus apium]